MKRILLDAKSFYLELIDPLLRTKMGRSITVHIKKDWMLNVFCIVTSVICAYAIYWIMYFLIFALALIYCKVDKLNIDNASWLNFFGTLIGGFATMGGVIWTIKYERKRDEVNRLRQAQPILILNAKECRIEYMPNVFIVSISDIIIENIGHNIALDISLKTELNPLLLFEPNGINKLSPGITAKAELHMISSGDTIMKDLTTYDRLKIDQNIKLFLKEGFVRKCLGDQYNLVEKKVSYLGYIILTYKDIYKNSYRQEFESTIHIVKMKDEYRCFLECHFLSKA